MESVYFGKLPGNPPEFGRIPGKFPKINGLHNYPISNSDYVTGPISVGAPIVLNTIPHNTRVWVLKTDDTIYRS